MFLCSMLVSSRTPFFWANLFFRLSVPHCRGSSEEVFTAAASYVYHIEPESSQETALTSTITPRSASDRRSPSIQDIHHLSACPVQNHKPAIHTNPYHCWRDREGIETKSPNTTIYTIYRYSVSAAGLNQDPPWPLSCPVVVTSQGFPFS